MSILMVFAAVLHKEKKKKKRKEVESLN